MTLGADLQQTFIAPLNRALIPYMVTGSDRHLRDISAMRRITGATINADDISRWVARLGLEHAWERALAWNDLG